MGALREGSRAGARDRISPPFIAARDGAQSIRCNKGKVKRLELGRESAADGGRTFSPYLSPHLSLSLSPFPPHTRWPPSFPNAGESPRLIARRHMNRGVAVAMGGGVGGGGRRRRDSPSGPFLREGRANLALPSELPLPPGAHLPSATASRDRMAGRPAQGGGDRLSRAQATWASAAWPPRTHGRRALNPVAFAVASRVWKCSYFHGST